MADNFTPITLNTQQEVDHFFADRIAQAKRVAAAEAEQRYAGFDDFKAKAEKYDADTQALNDTITALKGEKETSAAKITELEGKIRAYEASSAKLRIARETGLPAELADYLSGEDDAAIRAAAEAMLKVIRAQAGPAPMYRQNGEGGDDGRKAAYKDLLKKVRNE